MSDITMGGAPGGAPGSPEDNESGGSSSSTLAVGAFVDYLLTWSAQCSQVYAGDTIPVRFTLSRKDGTTLQIVSGDTATIQVTDPTGAQSSAGTPVVSTEGTATSVDFGLLYSYGIAGNYTIQITVQHDSQTIIARKLITAL